MSLYEDLGVPKTADRATIKRTYRKKAQQLHPDRPGGDVNKFHAIQKAYDVLGDDARRANYDATGADGHQDHRGMLMQRMAALFMQLVEQNDVDHTDIITLMREGFVNGKDKTKRDIAALQKRVDKYERAKNRLKRNGAGDNVFAQMLDGSISMVRRGIEMGKLEIENVDEMLTILKDYQYSADGGAYSPNTMHNLMRMAATDVFGAGNVR